MCDEMAERWQQLDKQAEKDAAAALQAGTAAGALWFPMHSVCL
jgi:hypothetical protein